MSTAYLSEESATPADTPGLHSGPTVAQAAAGQAAPNRFPRSELRRDTRMYERRTVEAVPLASPPEHLFCAPTGAARQTSAS